MRLLVIFLLLCTLSLAGVSFAQSSDQAELESAAQASALSGKAATNAFSLIDFSRIKWSHSYSVGFFSGGGSSGSMGLFNTSMLYEFSPKLSLTVNLGLAHAGGAFSVGEQSATILPGFTLDYHPSDKFRMTFMMQQYNGLYTPNYYRSSFWHNPLGP